MCFVVCYVRMSKCRYGYETKMWVDHNRYYRYYFILHRKSTRFFTDKLITK